MEETTILFTALELVILTTYLIVTDWPKTLNEARLKVLEALIGNPKFLKDSLSSLYISSSLSSTLSFSFNNLSYSLESIKVNFWAILLTNSMLSFSSNLTSFEVISDFISKVKSLGPKMIWSSSGWDCK